AEHGHVITARRVERWRAHGLLPANQQEALGRGRGSTSESPTEAFELVVWLAEHTRPGQRPRDLVLGAFGAGLAVPEATVRGAFVDAINGIELAVERTMPPGTNPEEIAGAVVETGWRGSLVPARIRRIDRTLAKAGVDWAHPTLAALDPGHGSGQEP